MSLAKTALQDKWIEVFDGAKHGRDWPTTAEELARIADNYCPEFHEAPVKLDHADAGPAGAWVKELKAEGTRLLARLGQVADWFAELVREGRFKKRSVELYRDLQGRGPYLRAVAFLGAAVPAIKGLREIAFQEDEPEFSTFEAELEIPGEQESEGEETASPIESSPAEETAAPTEAAEAERYSEADVRRMLDETLTHVERQNRELRQELQSMRELRDRTDFERFLEEQAQAGKPANAWREAGVMELYLGLEENAEAFNEDAEAVDRHRREALKAVLAATPAVVQFGELAREEAREPQPMPPEASLESVELVECAEAWLAQHPGRTFAEALAAVAR